MDKMNLLCTKQRMSGVLPFREFSHDDVYSISLGATSKGNQEKYKTKDGCFYIKKRFEYQQQLWKDDLVEVTASQYAYKCKLPFGVSVVRQGQCLLDSDSCSYSEAFDINGAYFITFSRALGDNFNIVADKSRSVQGLHDWFSLLRDFYSECSGKDQTEYLLSMMVLDLIVLNEDRHLSNFGYLIKEGSKLLTPSVLFDFGLGLFEHNTSYYENMPLDRALKKARIKPWDAKVPKVLDFLESEHSDFVEGMVPSEVQLCDFKLPSTLAKTYFKWINERLGVKIVDM